MQIPNLWLQTALVVFPPLLLTQSQHILDHCHEKPLLCQFAHGALDRPDRPAQRVQPLQSELASSYLVVEHLQHDLLGVLILEVLVYT